MDKKKRRNNFLFCKTGDEMELEGHDSRVNCFRTEVVVMDGKLFLVRDPAVANSWRHDSQIKKRN